VLCVCGGGGGGKEDQQQGCQGCQAGSSTWQQPAETEPSSGGRVFVKGDTVQCLLPAVTPSPPVSHTHLPTPASNTSTPIHSNTPSTIAQSPHYLVTPVTPPHTHTHTPLPLLPPPTSWCSRDMHWCSRNSQRPAATSNRYVRSASPLASACVTAPAQRVDMSSSFWS
jgi:hypothetical protein